MMGLLDNPLGIFDTLLAGRQEKAPTDQIHGLASQIRSMANQLSPVSQAGTLATVNASRLLPLKDRLTLLSQTRSQLPQLLVQTAVENAQVAQQRQQSQASQEYLASRLGELVSSGDAQAQFIRNLLPSVPEQFRGVLEYDAQNRSDYGRRLADSLMQQFQAQPYMDAYERQLAAQGKSTKSSVGSLQSQLG